MNIQRFTGATSREALAKARMAFGDATLILSNRPTPLGVEVMATTEDTLSSMGQRERSSEPPALRTPVRPVAVSHLTGLSEGQHQVEEDATQLAMSTLSFQDYVRERMLRKRQTESPARADETERVTRAAPVPRQPVAAAPAPSALVQPPVAQPNPPRSIMTELQAMRDLIEDRFNTFAWLGQARQHPIQSNLMLKLMRAESVDSPCIDVGYQLVVRGST